MTRFRFVQDHQAKYPVKRLCELVECSRSGFYAWLDRPLSEHYLAGVDLAAEIFEIHLEAAHNARPAGTDTRSGTALEIEAAERDEGRSEFRSRPDRPAPRIRRDVRRDRAIWWALPGDGVW